MKFKLKETAVDLEDGQSVLVRELTYGERVQWIKAGTEDRFRGPPVIIAAGSIKPKFTEEEVVAMPKYATDALVNAILKLSGVVLEETPDKKEPDARGVVPMSAESGAGDLTE
jgi:hypothetical protein